MEKNQPVLTLLISSAAQIFIWFAGTPISDNIDQFIALMFIVIAYLFLAVFPIFMVLKGKIGRKNVLLNAVVLCAGACFSLLIRMHTTNMGDAGIGLAVASIIVLILMAACLLVTGILFVCIGRTGKQKR